MVLLLLAGIGILSVMFVRQEQKEPEIIYIQRPTIIEDLNNTASSNYTTPIIDETPTNDTDPV